jgi:hypothetical protein
VLWSAKGRGELNRYRLEREKIRRHSAGSRLDIVHRMQGPGQPRYRTDSKTQDMIQHGLKESAPDKSDHSVSLHRAKCKVELRHRTTRLKTSYPGSA